LLLDRRERILARMAVELRPYQQEAIAPLRQALVRHRRVVAVAPTGAGKGVLLAWMSVEAAARGKRVLIALHRVELVRQTLAALAEHQVAAGVIAAGHAELPELAIQVAMVPTLARPQRLKKWAAWNPDLLVVDECHHLLAKSWERLIEGWPLAYACGFTASPIRLDGKGLGRIFRDLVMIGTTRQLIADGWLAPIKYLAPPSRFDAASIRVVAGEFDAESAAAAMRRAHLVGDAIEHYRRHVHGPAIGFGASISHSQELAAEFAAAGIRARHVDADTPAGKRAAAVAGLADGGVDVVFNVGLFTEGIDVPALAGVLLLRPTQSLGLYLQMTGRGLRVAPGKEEAVIVDHAGNCFRFGLPDDDFEWSLKDRERRPAKEGAPVKRCPECQAIVKAAAKVCPHCEADLRADAPAPEVIEGTLEIVDPQQLLRRRLAAMPLFRAREWAAGDYRRLRLIADIRGYKAGWAWHEQQRAMEAGR
jgi:superfamily II DNA or RNA helicase